MIVRWILIGGWSATLIVSTFYRDPTEWYELRSVYVSDTKYGTSPKMKVDRTIKKPFIGEWTVKVNQVIGEQVVEKCPAVGVTRYMPENSLPHDLDLDWWTFPTVCNLKPGRYEVDTQVAIRVHGLFQMYQSAKSNQFQVKP